MNKLYIKSIVISMIFLLCQNLVSATTITIPKVWATNDTLTAADLNSGFSTIFNDYNGSINPSNFATTLTFTSTQYLDLSAITSSTTKGLRLPTGTTGGTNNGQIAWDATAKALRVGDGTSANFDTLVAAQGTAGQLLRSGGGNALSTWTTPTFPNTGGTAGQWLRTDGTNYGLSTPTLPNSAGSSGNVLTSDGTNFTSSAAYASVTGTFTRDVSLTTSLTVTVIGITPSRCDFTMTNNTPSVQLSVGRSDSTPTAGQGFSNDANLTADTFDGISGVWRFVASGSNHTLATMSSYASGSMTLAFTKTGTPTGTAYVTWRCER